MENNEYCEPKLYPGVTISSTFTDLKEHRAALIKQIDAHGLKSVGMEHSSASFKSIIESSLEFVRDGAAYIGIISNKYGQVPESLEDNPDSLSITELEFNEALRQNRPILLFIMSDEHPVLKRDVERDPEKIKKLEAFTARAKQMGKGSKIHRVRAEFDSVEDFAVKAGQSLAVLKPHLENGANESPKKRKVSQPQGRARKQTHIPQAPTLYAVPPYIGSHKFVGRKAEMDTIDDWARPADSDSILLFEAIGGNGKSMLTWEWVTNRAAAVRKDWAGVLWYSFYEKGAEMSDFCRHALSYMTEQSIDDFKKMKTAELRSHLLPLLNARPWLIILDGLERVLVAYNRIDAAEAADEDMDNPDDKIVNRDPCSCISVEDDELLRMLAGARPSKILISSRLPPKALINNSNQHIQGVKPVKLQGLRPGDAEELFKSCGITGDSAAIQEYLTANCGNHPLTIGVLAGLINNYLPARGDFNTWSKSSDGGGRLNFAELDLVQRRNHILSAALHALQDTEKQLLSTLALMSEAVDYKTLAALNPHLPPEPEKVVEPERPEDSWDWEFEDEDKKEALRKEYERELKEWQRYTKAKAKRPQSKEYKEALTGLQVTVKELEQRGLLQYDHNSKRYDLHPVVRHVASGGLKETEKEQYGWQVVDFFTAQPHNPYEQAESLLDLSIGISIVHTLLKMGRYKEAYNVYWGDLANALLFNLEAHQLTLALISPFFKDGWGTMPPTLDARDGALLANNAAIAFNEIDEYDTADILNGLSLVYDARQNDLIGVSTSLRNFSTSAVSQNRLATDMKIKKIALSVSELSDKKESLFISRLFIFGALSRMGRWEDADVMWALLDPMGRNWNWSIYRPGDAEANIAWHQFRKGALLEQQLSLAEKLASEGRNRITIRHLHHIRGLWCLEKKDWGAAIKSFAEAVRLAREAATADIVSETWLAYTRLCAGDIDLAAGGGIAEELSASKTLANQPLAELWLALGNMEEAKKYALSYYKQAWADGEPYVKRYDLDKAIELLKRLGVEPPVLPPYDATKDVKYPWESEVEQLIERERRKKEAGQEE